MPNDFISREESMKELTLNIQVSAVYGLCSFADVQRALESVPAADVAPVVRCGECIHRVNMEHSMDNKEICCGRMAMRVMALDDYCSHGVRIDGGEHNAD